MLLTHNEENRPTISEAMSHKWIKQAIQSSNDNLDGVLATNALKLLSDFQAENKLKQATFAFIASQLLSKSQKKKFDKIYRAMDTNGDGYLSRDEIRQGYQQFYEKQLEPEEIDEIISKADFDNNGKISYSEFIVATMDKGELLQKSNLRAAFDLFDTDHSGFISKREIVKVLTFGARMDESKIKKVMQEIDIDNDGQISYEEFCQMMLEKIELIE